MNCQKTQFLLEQYKLSAYVYGSVVKKRLYTYALRPTE